MFGKKITVLSSINPQKSSRDLQNIIKNGQPVMLISPKHMKNNNHYEDEEILEITTPSQEPIIIDDDNEDYSNANSIISNPTNFKITTDKVLKSFIGQERYDLILNAICSMTNMKKKTKALSALFIHKEYRSQGVQTDALDNLNQHFPINNDLINQHLPITDLNHRLPINDNINQDLPINDNLNQDLPINDNLNQDLPINDSLIQHLPITDSLVNLADSLQCLANSNELSTGSDDNIKIESNFPKDSGNAIHKNIIESMCRKKYDSPKKKNSLVGNREKKSNLKTIITGDGELVIRTDLSKTTVKNSPKTCKPSKEKLNFEEGKNLQQEKERTPTNTVNHQIINNNFHISDDTPKENTITNSKFILKGDGKKKTSEIGKKINLTLIVPEKFKQNTSLTDDSSKWINFKIENFVSDKFSKTSYIDKFTSVIENKKVTVQKNLSSATITNDSKTNYSEESVLKSNNITFSCQEMTFNTDAQHRSESPIYEKRSPKENILPNDNTYVERKYNFVSDKFTKTSNTDNFTSVIENKKVYVQKKINSATIDLKTNYAEESVFKSNNITFSCQEMTFDTDAQHRSERSSKENILPNDNTYVKRKYIREAIKSDLNNSNFLRISIKNSEYFRTLDDVLNDWSLQPTIPLKRLKI